MDRQAHPEHEPDDQPTLRNPDQRDRSNDHHAGQDDCRKRRRTRYREFERLEILLPGHQVTCDEYGRSCHAHEHCGDHGIGGQVFAPRVYKHRHQDQGIGRLHDDWHKVIDVPSAHAELRTHRANQGPHQSKGLAHGCSSGPHKGSWQVHLGWILPALKRLCPMGSKRAGMSWPHAVGLLTADGSKRFWALALWRLNCLPTSRI